MTKELSDSEQQKAHQFYSVQCFNLAWELLEKSDRTSEDDQQMILLNQTSLWHWTQRKDRADRNLSIGYWQASRIHSVLGDAQNALKSANSCMRVSQQEPAFFVGYAFEALARAHALNDDQQEAKKALNEAKALADKVADEESKQMLLSDLDTINL